MRTLKKFNRQFKGSSFPTEIETTSGETFVLKMRGTGNSVSGLINEFIVNRVAAALGWEVPSVVPVIIPQNFPWNFGTDEFDDILQRSFGVNLGIEFFPSTEPLPANEVFLLPEGLLKRMVALDTFFCNFDRMAASQNILVNKDRDYWLIDHGSCLFMDRNVSEKNFLLPKNHVLKQHEEALNYTEALSELLQFPDFSKIILELPKEWLAELKVSPQEIQSCFDTRIRVLKNSPPSAL